MVHLSQKHYFLVYVQSVFVISIDQIPHEIDVCQLVNIVPVSSEPPFQIGHVVVKLRWPCQHPVTIICPKLLILLLLSSQICVLFWLLFVTKVISELRKIERGGLHEIEPWMNNFCQLEEEHWIVQINIIIKN